MPIYEYRCEACDERFDRLFVSISQVPSQVECPACHSARVRRLLSAPAIHTAGEGGVETAEEQNPPPQPPIFGRKELNEALRAKQQIE